MLEMRPNCECCGTGLLAQAEAFICSFECTFCADCARGRLRGICPNCGGELTQRPSRSLELQAKHPPSQHRHMRAAPCP